MRGKARQRQGRDGTTGKPRIIGLKAELLHAIAPVPLATIQYRAGILTHVHVGEMSDRENLNLLDHVVWMVSPRSIHMRIVTLF